jgi:ribosomal protein S12 methylthiotransferase
MGQLGNSGVDVSFEPKNGKADVVVINTCGFINDAKEESINTILQYIEAKNRGEYEQVYVMGCLSQRYIRDLEKEIPEVKKYFGVNNIRDIVNDLGGIYREELIGERKLSTPSHYAYLKISEGCNRHCTFCAIPSIRGRHISRPMEEIVSETRRLVAKGVKEIMLIAQDLTHYGIDLYKKHRLPELVETLADIRGVEWIRLHYAYPAGFPEDLIRVIKEHPNVCKYLDIPIQHINNRMLSLMQRGHNKEQTINLLENIRKKIPGVALRTTLIAGYPGETDEEFQELLDFIQEFRFDRLGVFAYSHEEGTTAFKLKDNVPANVKRERVEQIMSKQQEISFELNQKRVGQTIKTIIDRKEGDYYIGRTEFDSPEIDNEVLIPADKLPLKKGQFYPVTIQKTDFFDLFGTVSQF